MKARGQRLCNEVIAFHVVNPGLFEYGPLSLPRTDPEHKTKRVVPEHHQEWPPEHRTRSRIPEHHQE